MGGKPLSVIYINNPVFGGFFRLDKDCRSGFIGVNTVGDPQTNPDVANAAGDVSEKRLIELVRAAPAFPTCRCRSPGSRAGGRPPTLRGSSRKAASSWPAMPRT